MSISLATDSSTYENEYAAILTPLPEDVLFGTLRSSGPCKVGTRMIETYCNMYLSHTINVWMLR